MHTEAVLLVDHGKTQIAKDDRPLKQRMGADQEIDFAIGQGCKNFLPPFALFAAGQDRRTDAGSVAEFGDVVIVLSGENFRRRHDRRLGTGLDHICRRQQGDDGLAGADIALQQPQHALGAGEIGADFGYRLLLAGG